MTQITSHILDTSRGSPAEGVLTILMQQQNDDWLMLGSASTDADGRIADFTGPQTEPSTGSTNPLPGGIYKLTFYMSGYYENLQQSCFYPYIEVVFEISGDGQHYHVPLLVNPYGYSTYRGS
ncbi:MAG: hydroxyisourate hydrolase [Granulosicoccus sp.]